MKVSTQKRYKKHARIATIALLISIALSLIGYGIYYYTHQTPVTPTTIDKTKNISPEGKIIDNGMTKQDIKNTTPAASSASNILISISTAGQDNHGGPLVIGAIISNVSSGNCTYVLSKNEINKTYSSTINLSGTTYICNYSVPFGDLSIGVWQLTVKAQKGDKSEEVTRSVTISG